MSIENRDLSDGMQLVAKYKGEVWRANVGATEDGLRIKLEDGRLFKSVSAAGSAIMGGNACNGWRFWSIADTTETAATKTAKPAKRPAKKAAPAKKASPKASAKKATGPKPKAKIRAASFEAMPATDDQPSDVARYYCPGCADAFTAESTDVAPKVCPQGHKPGEPGA